MSVKINIATIFLNMARSTYIITYVFSKIKTISRYAFKKIVRIIFMTIHGFAFLYISVSRFCKKYSFCSKPSWRIYKQLKSKYTFIFFIIFCLQMIKLAFLNFFLNMKVCVKRIRFKNSCVF